jgi:outer membrane protein OmpA-like peptidoglycan-associated protein
MTRLHRAARLLAEVLMLLSGIAAAAAQQYKEDDALPPGTHGEVRALTGKVLALKPVVLPLKAVVLELRGAGAAMGGRVQSLEGALKDLGATVKGREIKINLAADVLFDFDKADLRPEAGPSLERVLAVLKSYPKAQALIDGHTDGKGNDQYNQKLSERRADSVRRWLGEHGAGTAMTVHGWGKSRPVAPNTKPDGADDPEGRQKNRRVEITVKT